MANTYSELADKLRPYLASPSGSVQVIVAGGGGAMAVHDIGGEYHSGQLAQAQAPWAATKMELAQHAAEPDAHHARAHVLATNTGLGPDHTISGAAAGWVLRATASNAARMAQLMVPDLGASGANWDAVSLTAANTVGLRSPSADVRTGATEAYLKSNSAGELGLNGLAIGAAMLFSGANNAALYPDIQFIGNGFLAAEQSVYISIDSDSATADNAAAVVIGHDSPTTTGFNELFRFDEAGIATISNRVRVPLLDTAAGNMTLRPAGDLVLDPGGNDVLPAGNYAVNLGAINKKYLTLWAAELWVETLVAQDTIATIGGRVLIGPTTTLTRDLAAGDTQIYVKHNQMSATDKVYMEAAGKVEFMNITSGPTAVGSEWRYNVTRNLDGSGANDWFAGDAVFNTGQPGNGFIDLYSLSGIPRQGQSGQRAGPTIVGNVRAGTNYNNFRERWAVGNLNALYDYGNNEYGAAFGNPLTAWVAVDAANGFRVMQGATKRAQLDINGNFSMYDAAQYLYQGGVLVANLTPAYGLDFLTYDTPAPADYVRQVAWWSDLATRTTPVAQAFAATYDVSPGLSSDFFTLQTSRLGQHANGITLTAANGSGARLAQLSLITYSIASGYESRANLTAQNILFSTTPRVGADWGTAKALWHAGNLVTPIDRSSFNGDFRSSGMVVFSNLAATAYQGILAQFVTNNSGNSYSSNAFTFLNGDGTQYQNLLAASLATASGSIYSDAAISMQAATGATPQAVRAGSLLAASNYTTYAPRVPTNGIYSQGGVAIGTPGTITSGYLLDVAGATLMRGQLSFAPISEPTTSSVNGILWMGTDNKLYFKKPAGTPILVAG